MDKIKDTNIFRCYTLDYIGKYRFYQEEEFIEAVKDGEYILENLKESNRFDYNQASYTFTKFGNISEGITEKNVKLEIEKDECLRALEFVKEYQENLKNYSKE